jgi:hypothetical protein
MSVEIALSRFAGFMVLLSVALTYWVHPNFIWLTVFVGANLFQSSFTGFCPAAIVLKMMGIKTEAQCALKKQD